MEWRSLPVDSVEDIFSRVPAKTLAQLRSTSKQWNVLLKSRSLAKMHSSKAPKEESLIITLIRSRVCLVRINLSASSVILAPLYLKDPHSKSNPSQVDIHNVFHCDGLLLCTTRDKRLVVWNPCSGETKWVKPRDSYEESDYYALGYDKSCSCKKYKILRVDRHQLIPIKNEYEIYDLASDSWRAVGVATDWFLGQDRRGVSLKGNTYWVSTQAVREPHDSPRDFLLSFDFSTEMFQSLPLPHPFPSSIWALSVVKDEQLCLLGIRSDIGKPSCLHLWVLASTGSWNKSLEVKDNYKRGRRYLQRFCKGVSFVADEKNTVVVYLNTNNILDIVRENRQILAHKFDNEDLRCISPSSVLLNYVPSLAHIQQGTPLGRRKRKAQGANDL